MRKWSLPTSSARFTATFEGGFHITMGSIVAPVLSLFVGGALATATLMGLVSSQTSAPENSPADAEAPVIDYGTVSE